MSIRIRLIVCIGLLIAAVLVSMVAIAYSIASVQSVMQQNSAAALASRRVLELTQLTAELEIRKEERPRIQWIKVQQALTEAIENLAPLIEGTEYSSLQYRLRHNNENARLLFNRWAVEGGPEISRVLSDSMMIRLRAMEAVTQRLLQDSRLAVTQEMKALIVRLAACLSLIGGSVILIALVNRRMIRSLDKLGQAMQALGEGKERVTVHVPGTDEFSRLAATLTDMSSRLLGSRDALSEANQRLSAEVGTRRQAEHQLRLAINSMDSAFAYFDAEDRLVVCNERFIDPGTRRNIGNPIGYTFEEILRAFAKDSFTAVDALPDRETWFEWRLDQHRNPRGKTLELQWTDGSWSALSERRTSDGGTVSLWTDISEQKQREAELADAKERSDQQAAELVQLAEKLETARQDAEHNETRFRGLLDSAPEAMVVADHTGKIVLTNAMTEEVFGYARSEILGQQVELLIPERLRDSHAANRARFQEAPKTRAMGSGAALFGRRKDGSEFPVEVSLSPVETNAGPLMFSAIRDITVRQQHEAELASAKLRAEAATHAKSDFLSQMSHELRTPLNAILGFAQILQLNQDKTLSSRQLGYCDDILKGGHTLLELVNDILDLEQAESGKIRISLERVAVADALKKLRDTAVPLASHAQVMLEVGAPREVPDVRTDSLRLHQVLLNLTSNAIKYNRPGGSVVVSAMKVPSGRVRIIVTDTGVGIPSDRQAELFQPFSRLGAERTEIQGTGIGLAYSKKLMETMGGTIGFSSRTGEGSTFWIELPADVGKAAGTVPAAADPLREPQPPWKAHGYTLLCVEDNPANLRFMEQLIATRPDIVMLSASTPALGRDLASVHHPDIIVLDIGLPEMDGHELLQSLRELPATRNTPVIALSARAMPAHIKRGLAAGFFRYLTKPIDVSAFFAAIDEALASSDSQASGVQGSI